MRFRVEFGTSPEFDRPASKGTGNALERGFGDRGQRFFGQECLMAGDEHIGENQETLKDVVFNDLV